MATSLLSLACRGDRSDMHACQSDWYNASTAPAARAVLKASYLDRQCSAGYGGRLCSQCQPGYGVSGVIINTFIVFAYIPHCLFSCAYWQALSLHGCELQLFISECASIGPQPSWLITLSDPHSTSVQDCIQKVLRTPCPESSQPPVLSLSDLLNEAHCAGRFQCSKCQSRGAATVQYIFLLLLVIFVNAFLVWLLLPEDISDWDHQGSAM